MIVAHVFKTTGLSGAEAHLLALARGLSTEGFESHFIILTNPAQSPDSLINEAKIQGTPTHQVEIANDLDLTVIPKLAGIFKTIQAQIIHTHMIHGDLFGTLAAGKRTVVQSRHNDDPFRRNLIVKLLTQFLAGRAKTVITISEALTSFVRDVEGVPAPQITRIYYGLDPNDVLSKIHASSIRAELNLGSAPVIGAVGRLTPQKGLDYLLTAFAQVLRVIPTAQLVIAGEGERRQALEAQAQNLSIAHAVHWLGWRRDVPAIMNELEALIVPSLWEGFGLVTLEAMALSKPIVASRVSALPEIVNDGDTGWLVPPANAEALATAIIKVLREPAAAKEMGRRGRTRLEKEFTLKRMAQQHASVYREAASRVPEFRA